MEPTTTPKPQARLATFLLLAILTFLPTLLFGTHIRGGYLTGVRISGGNALIYRFTVTIYRDTQGVPAQPGRFDFRDMDGQRISDGVVVDPVSIGFIHNGNTEVIIYQIEHRFPASGWYKVSYYEQNRNNGVRNMFASGSTAFFLESEFRVSPVLGLNSAPVSIAEPYFMAGIGQPSGRNYGFVDSEGDSLSYRLAVCKQGISQDGQAMEVIQYRYPDNPEFGGSRQNGSGPALFTMDPLSGDLIWDSPGQTGEYSFAFYVDEWRDGILISSVNCDMQIIVEDGLRTDFVTVINGQMVLSLGDGSEPVPRASFRLASEDTSIVVLTDNRGKFRAVFPKNTREVSATLLDGPFKEGFYLRQTKWVIPPFLREPFALELRLLPEAGLVKAITNAGFPRFRCGFPERAGFSVRAISEGDVSLEVEFVPGSKIGLTGVGPTADVESDGRVSWHFPEARPGQTFSFGLDLQMPDFESMGEYLDSYIITRITSSDGQSTSTDTTLVRRQLMCAYDPNDKLSVALATDRAPYILPGDVFEYTIRFQNVGNGPAYNVRINDPLEAKLDPSTFKLIGASHALTATLFKGTDLIFEFDDIMLPDSTTNEPESNGHVTFQIAPQEGLGHMQLIRNRALIYFDYNPPIITNYTEDYFVHYLPLYAPLLYGRYQDGQARLQVDNREPLPTTLLIERSQSEGFESIDTVFTLPGETGVFWDSGIAEGPTYYYRARVEGVQGHSGQSRTLVLDTQKKWAVPATEAPSGLVVEMEGRGVAKLSWQDNSGEATGFQLERSLWENFNPVTPYQLAAGTEAYEDRGLPMADSVYYRIKALTPYGESYYSNVASVSPLVTGLSGEAGLERQLLVYPVPAKRELYVEVEGHGAVGASLFGQTGVEVYRGSWQGDRAHRIGLEGIPPGLYLLRVATGGRFFTRKVVVE